MILRVMHCFAVLAQLFIALAVYCGMLDWGPVNKAVMYAMSFPIYRENTSAMVTDRWYHAVMGERAYFGGGPIPEDAFLSPKTTTWQLLAIEYVLACIAFGICLRWLLGRNSLKAGAGFLAVQLVQIWIIQEPLVSRYTNLQKAEVILAFAGAGLLAVSAARQAERYRNKHRIRQFRAFINGHSPKSSTQL